MAKLEFQVILLTIVQAHDYSIKSEAPGGLDVSPVHLLWLYADLIDVLSILFQWTEIRLCRTVTG